MQAGRAATVDVEKLKEFLGGWGRTKTGRKAELLEQAVALVTNAVASGELVVGPGDEGWESVCGPRAVAEQQLWTQISYSSWTKIDATNGPTKVPGAGLLPSCVHRASRTLGHSSIPHPNSSPDCSLRPSRQSLPASRRHLPELRGGPLRAPSRDVIDFRVRKDGAAASITGADLLQCVSRP